MTTPAERTRTIIQTHGFLMELERNLSLPEGIRVEATRLLRHYPHDDDVNSMSEKCPCLFAPAARKDISASSHRSP